VQKVRRRLTTFIVVVQVVLFLVHGFVYWTWSKFFGAPDPFASPSARIILTGLSVSFVVASLLAFRYSQGLVRLFYTIAAVWLGIVNFLLCAACLCWVTYAVTALFDVPLERRTIALWLFGLALCVSAYGVVDARWTRVRRISVRLAHLPDSWRGRAAALVSDMHLGHVRGRSFTERIVEMLNHLRPDVVFITGDLFDGTAVDLDWVIQPWSKLAIPLGAYFVEGNHEEFADSRKFLDAVRKHGIRVLNNEKTSVDGMDLIGVPYRTIVRPAEFQSALREAAIDRNRASILLAHAPNQLKIAEEAGVSLQLSGHTHRGQFFPWTWVTSRIYGPFVYGLNRFGSLWVYTTSGAGTWGPPVRLGAPPEIVLIRFDS
jgi:predicted MPP superfamily phosphohydrolase